MFAPRLSPSPAPLRPLRWAAALGLLIAPAHAGTLDPAQFWNQQLLDGIRAVEMSPTMAARDIAIANIAIYDAVNAATGQVYKPYAYAGGPIANADPAAAAFQAGWQALSGLFPSLTTTIDANAHAYGDALGYTAPASAAMANGISLGAAMGTLMIAERATDHATDPQPVFIGDTTPGTWRPTPPDYTAGITPLWGSVTPFMMTSSSQFPLPGPPALNSGSWADARLQVQCLGGATAPTGATASACTTAGYDPSPAEREANQATAQFWSNDADGTYKPPGQLVDVALGLASQNKLDLLSESRLLALLGTAMSDAAVAAWEAKYTYDFWRPITAVTDPSNPYQDPAWVPYLASTMTFMMTPSFPDYVSGHSTFAGAAAQVFTNFFGTDKMTFAVTSDTAPGDVRIFDSFLDAANEEGMSRIYDGFHFQFSNLDGINLGKQIGDLVFQNAFQSDPGPVPEPPTLALLGAGLVFLAYSRRPTRPESSRDHCGVGLFYTLVPQPGSRNSHNFDFAR